ncbi:uncharacterized protein LOC135694142 [Rhopilema esculentum]|uniref:uncharacterized protein LOC135694142 n=1 Tax=Rhopilema esculentum TaxID=499914 RepID=UPI0031D1427B
MKARLLLAALHFNENANRKQAMTKQGKERWKISYPKYKKGAVAKPVKTKPTYGYVTELLHMSVKRRLELSSYSESLTEAAQLYVSTPGHLTDNIEKEDKEEVVKQHKTRFLKVSDNKSVLGISEKDDSYEGNQQMRRKKRTEEIAKQKQETKRPRKK